MRLKGRSSTTAGIVRPIEGAPEIKGHRGYFVPAEVEWRVYNFQMSSGKMSGPIVSVVLSGTGRTDRWYEGGAIVDPGNLPEWLDRPDEWLEAATALVSGGDAPEPSDP